MSVLLIFISIISLTAIFYLVNYDHDHSLRLSLMKSSVIHGCIIVIFTEILSINHGLTFFSLFVGWGLITFINCGYLFFIIQKRKVVFKNPKLFNRFRALQLTDQISVIAVFIILLICLITALIAPPNNYDSMTYHMSKVMHWIQNGSVAHYRTSDLRQISFFPGAEYIITHLQILSGGDRFANSVQWFAFLGCILGTSLIAKRIIGNHTQAITALVCASIPMVIMQSTTTQNDLITSYWLVCLTYFILKSDRYSKEDFLWIGLSFGLSIMTKATAFIFSSPLLILFSLLLLKYFYKTTSFLKSVLKTIVLSFSITSLGIFFSLPTYIRNYYTFGTFLGIDTGTKATQFGVTSFISRIFTNLATNIGFPFFWKWVTALHDTFLKVDDYVPFIPSQGNPWRLLIPDEDFVGSPIIIILAITSFIYIIFRFIKSKEKNNLLLLLLLVIFGQFLLFCLLINWQQWINRLLNICLILASIPIGYFFKELCLKSYLKIINYLLIFTLIIQGMFYSLTPIHHPLISLPQNKTDFSQSESILGLNRQDIYFSGYGKELKSSYTKNADRMIQNHCYKLGIKIGGDQCEYPLWVLMQSKSQNNDVKIQHVEVNNESAKIPMEFPYSEICGIITQSWSGKTGQVHK